MTDNKASEEKNNTNSLQTNNKARNKKITLIGSLCWIFNRIVPCPCKSIGLGQNLLNISNIYLQSEDLSQTVWFLK